MAYLSEAYPAPNNDAKMFERAENPQTYDQLPETVRHVKERRHILGLVGGNEVSRIAGSLADLESDLQGITRPNTRSIARHHLPSAPGSTAIERDNAKGALKIDTTPVHLKAYQQWAYPSVIGPTPLVKETCSRPEKY